MEARDHKARLGAFTFKTQDVWRALALGISYLLVMWLSERYIPHPSTLFPAGAIAMAGLFFTGLEFWPVIYVVSLLGYYLLHTSLLFLLIVPVAQTFQAYAGAYLMRRAKVDPLFRRGRDVLCLIFFLAVVAFIVPSLMSLATLLGRHMLHTSGLLTPWFVRYVDDFFSLLIVTPLLMRWIAKPRFGRNALEIIELVGVFAVLIAVDVALCFKHMSVLFGVPLIYVLLAPLFWIALRLRPRFTTLALFITSVCVVVGLYSQHLSPSLFTTSLLSGEELLVVLAMIFLVVTSLEEDRRVNVNLLRSQMGTLANAVARVSSESEAKNSFIAMLAHELRNPLAPIMSAIDYLKLKEEREEDESEALSVMEDRMQVVRRLLDDLLDISRISEGKLTLKKERVALQAVIKGSVVSTTHHLKERHQLLSFKAPRERLYVLGDAVRLEQAFSNLLTNASKYSDPGTQVTIRLTKLGTVVEVSIIDTGMGISQADLDKIFSPFHQAAGGVRSKKGLGIGLTLVQSFVEMHGGSVKAESRGAGLGSEFTVTLPLMGDHEAMNAASDDPATVPVPLPPPAEVIPESKHGLHVLVVDDNDAAAWGIGRLLEMRGCRVSYAYDAQQAIDEALDLSPDIVLLDIGLPDRDGYETATAIRGNGFRGRIVALTGYSTDDARAKGEDAGFDYYLVKPAGFEDLKRAIPEIA